MKRLMLAALAAGLLGGCALPGGLKGLHADAERADTDASLAYVGIASSVDAYEASPSADKASAEALKRKAWNALGAVHAAYAAGQSIDLKPLEDLSRQVAALRSQP